MTGLLVLIAAGLLYVALLVLGWSLCRMSAIAQDAGDDW